MSNPRDLLIAFYREHNPIKLKDVDIIMETFAGREAEMLEALYKKYNVNKNINQTELIERKDITLDNFNVDSVIDNDNHKAKNKLSIKKSYNSNSNGGSGGYDDINYEMQKLITAMSVIDLTMLKERLSTLINSSFDEQTRHDVLLHTTRFLCFFLHCAREFYNLTLSAEKLQKGKITCEELQAECREIGVETKEVATVEFATQTTLEELHLEGKSNTLHCSVTVQTDESKESIGEDKDNYHIQKYQSYNPNNNFDELYVTKRPFKLAVNTSDATNLFFTSEIHYTNKTNNTNAEINSQNCDEYDSCNQTTCEKSTIFGTQNWEESDIQDTQEHYNCQGESKCNMKETRYHSQMLNITERNAVGNGNSMHHDVQKRQEETNNEFHTNTNEKYCKLYIPTKHRKVKMRQVSELGSLDCHTEYVFTPFTNSDYQDKIITTSAEPHQTKAITLTLHPPTQENVSVISVQLEEMLPVSCNITLIFHPGVYYESLELIAESATQNNKYSKENDVIILTMTSAFPGAMVIIKPQKTNSHIFSVTGRIKLIIRSIMFVGSENALSMLAQPLNFQNAVSEEYKKKLTFTSRREEAAPLISIYNGPDVLLQGCHVYSNNGGGIILKHNGSDYLTAFTSIHQSSQLTTKLECELCLFSKCGVAGIYAKDSTNYTPANIIPTTSTSTSTTSSSLSSTTTSISTSPLTACNVKCTNCRFISCEIGLHIHGVTCELHNCDVEKCTRDGIVVNGKSNFSNYISKICLHEDMVTTPLCMMKECLIAHNANNGILVGLSASVNFVKCIIEENACYGVERFTGCSLTFDKCVIQNNGIAPISKSFDDVECKWSEEISVDNKRLDMERELEYLKQNKQT